MSTTNPQSSVRLRNPMPDATSEGLTLENALLWRKIILLTVRDIKFSAAMELATGKSWDNIDLFSLDADGLREVVASMIADGLALSKQEAYERVREHETLANPSQVEVPLQGLRTPDRDANSTPET